MQPKFRCWNRANIVQMMDFEFVVYYGTIYILDLINSECEDGVLYVATQEAEANYEAMLYILNRAILRIQSRRQQEEHIEYNNTVSFNILLQKAARSRCTSAKHPTFATVQVRD